MKTDFLVIGSGAAGLSFALKAAEHGHVTLVTKGKMDECNTNYAQGGICSVTYAPDTFEKHIHDTLVCGAGKCDPAAVELVVRRAPELIRDLIAWGTKFDKTPDGRFELNREGGHTEHRILHHEDLTGAEIERALITSVRKHPNITVLEHHFAIDLLTQHHLGEFVTRHTRGLACFGAYVLNLESNEIETVLAKFTVVAAGGCGNVYSSTTNPSVATGDGIAMCHRAKAITENMEFIQFHPTSLYHPAEKPNFLITEAMRGYGAILRLQNGEEFMDKYHPMKSLAPRDVVARENFRVMQAQGGKPVMLDVSPMARENPDLASFLAHRFPTIDAYTRSLGFDWSKEPIPVAPAAHYYMGGIRTDLNARTSIPGLYAAGECARTGVMGSNRLASNSLLEGLVYGRRAGLAAVADGDDAVWAPEPFLNSATGAVFDHAPIALAAPAATAAADDTAADKVWNRTRIQNTMWHGVGVLRDEAGLKTAIAELGQGLAAANAQADVNADGAASSVEALENRNMLTVGYVAATAALARTESRGAHARTDHSEPVDNWAHSVAYIKD